MAATANVVIQATAHGYPYSSSTDVGSLLISATFTNSSSPGAVTALTLTTAFASGAVTPFLTSCKFVVLIPPSTYKGVYRLAGDTGSLGVSVRGDFPSVVSASSVVFNVHTTQGTQVSGFRVVNY